MQADNSGNDLVDSWDIRLDIQRSIRYHMRRSGFFERWNRMTSFVSVLFGSAAITSILGLASSKLGMAAAGIVTIVSAIDLVVGTSRLAWTHNDLRRRYIELECRIAARDLITKTEEADIRQAVLRIEADEPPVLSTLNEVAYNDVVQSLYTANEAAQYRIKINLLNRLTAQWV